MTLQEQFEAKTKLRAGGRDWLVYGHRYTVWLEDKLYRIKNMCENMEDGHTIQDIIRVIEGDEQ